MNLNIPKLVFQIRSNFWFIPALLALVAVAGALFAAGMDLGLNVLVTPGKPSSGGMSIETVRAVLSTIAGSMITVATLVFSMTLVALTLVSQQLGPRLLLRFMDDRPTQFVLGLFLATFLYALIVLVQVGRWIPDSQISGLSVVVAVVLAVLSMGGVIYFLHHVATRIQADVLIAELGEELRAAARWAVRQEENTSGFRDADERQAVDTLSADTFGRAVTLKTSGYLNQFNAVSALDAAVTHDLVVVLPMRRGSYLLSGIPALRVASREGKDADIDDDAIEWLRGTLSIGRRRTPEASMEFEINALVDVALRALSPGINDPHTAIACIYTLSDGMLLLMELKEAPSVMRDEDDNVRVVYDGGSFEHALQVAFHPIRRAARGHVLVLLTLVEALGAMIRVAPGDRHSNALRTHLHAIEQDCAQATFAKVDAEVLASAIETAKDAKKTG